MVCRDSVPLSTVPSAELHFLRIDSMQSQGVQLQGAVTNQALYRPRIRRESLQQIFPSSKYSPGASTTIHLSDDGLFLSPMTQTPRPIPCNSCQHPKLS